jgi:hypothetical protein
MMKNKLGQTKRRQRWLWGILGIIWLIPAAVFAQAEIASLEISEVNATEFPAVRVLLSASDPAGEQHSSVPASSLAVTENGLPQTILSVEPIQVGLRLVIVVDPGDGSYNTGQPLGDVLEKARADFQLFAFGRPWMLAGVDEILFVVQEGETTITPSPLSSNPDEIWEQISTHAIPAGTAVEIPEYGAFTRKALTSALREIKLGASQGDQRPTAILLYTPGMRADLADVAEEAILQGVPIHVILTREKATVYWSEALAPLAAVTGGTFHEIANRYDPEALFENLSTLRWQHELIYKSNVITPGPRQVTIELVNGENPAAASSEYTVALQAPNVSVISPVNGDLISRQASEDSDSLNDAEPNFAPVVARVGWPDGASRQIRQANLLVDGVVVGQAGSMGDQFEIAWDIRAYQSEVWTPATIQIEIIDELGMQAVSEPVSLAIRAIPATSAGFKLPDTILTYVFGGIALISLGLAIYLFINRGNMGASLQGARESLVDFVERVTGRRTAMVARAHLVPMDGFDEPPSKALEIYGTTAIGRSRRHADLLFHIGEEDSPISRLHCTLLDNDDHFSIRDEDSSNGTFMNGERLTPLQPAMLHDGDVLDIAPLERGGVRLMYQHSRARDEQPLKDEFGFTRPRSLEQPVMRDDTGWE